MKEENRKRDKHLKVLLGAVILKTLESGVDNTSGNTKDTEFRTTLIRLINAGLAELDLKFVKTSLEERRDDGKGRAASRKPATSTSTPAPPSE